MKAKRHYWTERELALLREFFPDWPTAWLADELGRNADGVHTKAHALGLHKSAAFRASVHSGRVQRGQQDPRMRKTQFKPGMTPWNKGRKGWIAGGRSVATQFKKGEMRGAAQHNYVPIGTERLNFDGVLERKITDDHPVPARRWRSVHSLVWEAAHGPIPKGSLVVFKPGQRTNVRREITADKLECITRAENMRRNSVHQWPDDLKRLLRLKAALNRKIHNREAKA